MMNYTKRANNTIEDEFEAVQDIAKNIGMESMCGIIFFCSSKYDLDKISQAINENFSCEVIGCTTAGEMSDTRQKHGIVAVSFNSSAFAFHSAIIEDERDFSFIDAQKLTDKLEKELRFNKKLNKDKMFAFLLNDGLTAREDYVTSSIYSALGGIELFGGSAGDDYDFKNAPVFINGEFHKNAGILSIIETTLDFSIKKIQHYTSSDRDMVITKADPLTRTVYEINGAKASEELAEIIGVDVSDLTLEIYSTHPLMLEINDEWYVRAISHVFEDGSMRFACAIAEGIPLTIGKITGLKETLASEVENLKQEFRDIELTIGCECVHRALEIEALDAKEEVERIMKPLSFIGFSTYGEQFNSIHVNQTLTCVVIGKK